jgi:hypothetical protein
MSRAILVLLLFCLTAGTSAQVYRWVDGDGQTHYSDRPVPGSDRVSVRSGAPTSQAELSSSEPPLAPLLGPYTSFEIVSPVGNETLRLESPILPVSLLLEPPLMAGHRLELVVDGVPIKAEDSIATQLTLSGLSYGTHVTEARVLDSAGIVARSAPVSFHLRRPLAPGVIP